MRKKEKSAKATMRKTMQDYFVENDISIRNDNYDAALTDMMSVERNFYYNFK